jgi:polyphosphate glucokinase
MQMLGVDIGGSGIKGCLVDTETGELIGERHRIATPQPATPAAVAHTLKALVEHFQWKGPVGCGFPATIHNGIAKNASNIDKSWIETDAAHLFADVTGLPCHVLNDADAAGLAEMRFGTGQDRQGVIILITVGTALSYVRRRVVAYIITVGTVLSHASARLVAYITTKKPLHVSVSV